MILEFAARGAKSLNFLASKTHGTAATMNRNVYSGTTPEDAPITSWWRIDLGAD